MSRSVRRTPIFGNASGVSEKADKRVWHQRWRTRARTLLARTVDLEAYVDPDVREVSDPWLMAKDGRHYWLPRMRPTSPGRSTYEEREAQLVRSLRK